MIVKAKQVVPTINDLIQELKSKFSDYTYSTLHSKPQKIIIIRKSILVGAQVTVRDNEITVHACYPNVLFSSLMTLLTSCCVFPANSWTDFEIKISDFLKKKYNN
ncbi:hypothetical protein [Marivirga sp.]|uniref:hypothetical protein n=1 Tax=Marivirga sp. TaxID=2018662 RepID=UPI0025EE9D86|nr:hypothetical protein [Marivirga sp.]